MEHNQVEQTILGAMLMEPLAVVDAMASLHWIDFALSSHQDIFRTMMAMYERGEAIDGVTLPAAMGPVALQAVGGRDYIAGLTIGVPRHLAMGRYIGIVTERALARRGAILCQTAHNRLLDPTESAESVLDELAKELGAERKEDSKTAREVMHEVLESLERQDTDAISTGIERLDEMTSGGMRPKELWIIGAQPSGGKSSLARQLERAALRKGVGVHSHSIEVPKEDWVKFHVARQAGVPAWKLRQPWMMAPSTKDAMREAAGVVSKWPLVIDDAGSVHIRTLLAKSRLSCLRRGVKVYTVDYLQMLRGDEREMRQLMGNAARSLKQFAKDNNCVVVALSQMKRSGDVSSRPSLQDLKESGDIEAAADVAILNYRPKRDDQYTGEDELIVAKQRNGPIGAIPMTYNSETLSFEERS